MDFSILADYGLIALAIVALAILSVIGVFALKLIQKLLAKFGIVLTDAQLLSLKNITTQVVKTLNQTVVGKLKELNPDSKLTDEEKAEVYNQAVDLIKKAATSEQIDALTKQYGDVDTGLRLFIETAVSEEKK